MPYRLESMEGVGPVFAEKLAAINIRNTGDLLRVCGERQGRQDVAQRTGLNSSLLLKWTNMADLMRIPGIGPQYAELLEAAGIDTVKELRTRNAVNLSKQTSEVNQQKKLTRGRITESKAQKWINIAKSTRPSIEY